MLPPFTDPTTGIVYTFDHLNQSYETVSVRINGQHYLVPITLVYSNHCFTNGKDYTVSQDDPLYILTDGTGRRAFSLGRYQQSLVLPDRLRQVIANSGHCHKLKTEGNYIHIHDPWPSNRFAGWYVYFTFDNPKADAPEALKVSIRTYHHRSERPQDLRWTASYKFPAFVADWLSSRPNNLARCQLVDDTKEEIAIGEREKEKPA